MAVKVPEEKKKVNGYEILDSEQIVEFPLYIFPQNIENIINQLKISAGFEKAVSAASILFTVSSIIGNSKKIRVKSVWIDTPNIWIAIIGRRGTMKTPTINFGIAPLKHDERNYAEDFKNEMRVWNVTKEGNKPKRKQRYSNDVTVEGLIKALQENPNGMGLFKDELNGFFEEMSRYKAGGNLEFYLSAFSGGMYTKNRMTYDAITIDDIFLSIIGSVQPEVLKSISQNNTVNGMIDRWLFVKSKDQVYEFDFNDMDSSLIDQYNYFIEMVKKWSESVDNMEWTVGGLDALKEGMNAIESIMKDDNTSDKVFTYLSKMKTYFPRFCTLIPIMHNSIVIEKHFVEYAFKLITFFIDTAMDTFLEFDNNLTYETIFKKENAVTAKEKILALRGSLPLIKVTLIAQIVGCSRKHASNVISKSVT